MTSLILFNCSEDPAEPTNGVDGFNALVDIQNEAAGENCSTGGVKISVGQDSNENGVLDDDEVSSISFICNGSSGSNGEEGPALVARTSPEEPGENCEAGGTLVEIGADQNGNNALDNNEVQTSFFVCNGLDGSDGTGSGSDGLSSLIRVTPDDSCPNGGIQIEVGLDSNANGSLDAGEVQSTYSICNGTDGTNGTNGSNGFNTLSNVTTENPGANCANGGLKVQLGLDTNRNGSLDNEEVVSENYVCHGANGSDGSDGSDGTNGTNGISSITRVTTEDPGANCTSGGLKIEIGMDDVNTDGSLQNEEVDYTYYVCNGADGNDGSNGSDGTNGSDGLNSLIRTTNESAGANCPNGGIRIDVGLDTDRNGNLEAGEFIGSPIYVCNGQNGSNGSDGADGKSVIVTSTPAGAACSNGGTTLTFGYDNNNDGDLEDGGDEILTSYSVCNGLNGSDGSDGNDGANTIIITSTENPGANCANGGLEFQVGVDLNGNNSIDTGEEIGTYYVCNGADGSNGSNGNNSLITVTSFSGSQGGCTNGGLIIRTGVDDNGNGILNAGEIDATSYVCDGSDGSDGSSDNIFEFYFQEGFDGYSGVVDVSVSDKQGTEAGETFSVDRKPEGDFHGLIYFPEVDAKIQEVISGEFEIVEAILYLRGKSTRIDGVSADNYIGVKTLIPEAPLFDVSRVSWTAANATQNWQLPGVTDNSTDADANAYSDMFRLPYNITFDGYIPLLLNRNEIKQWANSKDSNKGLVLLMADDLTQYELDIVSSKNTKDDTYRPLLYLKVKTGVRARTSSYIEHRALWNSLSYEQKLAPLKRRNRD